MCEITTALSVATAVMGGLGTVAQAVSANQQMQAQAAYQEAQAREYARAAELNNQKAIREYEEQSAAESIKEMQENAAASREKQDIQRDMLQKRGTMLASTNAAGMALDYMLTDYGRQFGTQMDKVSEQSAFNAQAHAVNKATYQRQAQNTIDSQQSYIAPSVSSGGASAIGTALGIGSSILNGANMYMKYNYGTDKSRNQGGTR